MNSEGVIQLGSLASVRLIPDFLNDSQARHLLDKWTDEMPWEQSEISLFGKQLKIPRLNTWYGDKPYAYSGTRFEARPMTTELAMLKESVQRLSGLEFNSALINWYRDGQDCMGWHSDDEKSLGKDPQIASVSLGDSRRFVLREKNNKTNKHVIELHNGSLLLMLGKTQSFWQHSLPRTKKSENSRVNLTFRYIY